MQAKICPGYEGGISIGQRQAFVFTGTGKSGYSNATHDPVSFPVGVYIDVIPPAVSISGTYLVVFKKSAANTTRATWTALWFTMSGMTEANSVDLSGESVDFMALGGEF